MRRIILILAVLAGAAVAFVLCGGLAVAGQVAAALNNPPAPISVQSLAQ